MRVTKLFKILYISGPAAADAITGISDDTIRSGRQTDEDVATAGTFIGDRAGRRSSSSPRATPSGRATSPASRPCSAPIRRPAES